MLNANGAKWFHASSAQKTIALDYVPRMISSGGSALSHWAPTYSWQGVEFLTQKSGESRNR
jgi:hypothetical protein